LSKTTVNSITGNATANFTVKPQIDLATGDYSAIVTVTNADNTINKSFNVTFKVTTPTVGARIEIKWAAGIDKPEITPTAPANNIKQGDNVTINASFPTGWTVKEWIVDGKTISGQTDSNYVFSSRDVGKHTVTLLVKDIADVYSASVEIDVGPAP